MPRRNYDHSYYDDPGDSHEYDDIYRRPSDYARRYPRGSRRGQDPYRDNRYHDYDRNRQYPSEPRDIEKKPSSTGKMVAAIFIIIILILSVLVTSAMIFNTFDPFNNNIHREVPEQINFTLEKEVIISTSVSDGSPTSFTYKASIPKDRNIGDVNLQNVVSVSPSPRPDNGYPDLSGSDQDFMMWEESSFRGTMVIRISYSISTSTFVWSVTEENSGDLDDIPQDLKDQYLENEWKIDYDGDNEIDPQDDLDDDGDWDYLIEVTDPKIASRAENLTKGKTDVYSQLRSIYDYLTSSDSLNYVTTQTKSIPQDCVSTLNLLKGDCDDYSILFISLSRASGIPAWLELGVIFDPESGGWGAHAWAKVCIPFIDGSYTIATVDIVNQEFLIHDAYRFTEWIDTGGDIIVEGKPINNLEYYYHSFSYVIPNNGNSFPTIQETYSTQTYREFGDTIEIPIENTEDDQQSVPSFELGLLLLAVVVIIFYFKKIELWR